MLYQHQKDFLTKSPNRSALVWSCGTGKTRTAIEWAKQKGGTTLIVCPKALKTNWESECEKWGLKEKLILTKENFKKTSGLYFKNIIVDEIHNGFLTPMFKSQMSKHLRKFINDVHPNVLLLSATVYSSSPWNIFNLAYYLGIRWNWQEFNYTFFNQVRMGNRFIPVAKVGSEKRLAEAVKKFASVVDINDCMDVPPQIHSDPELFELTPKQSRAITANYDPLPIVRYTKQHEIENGILLPNEFTSLETFDCYKNDRLIDLVDENPKIAIVCRYNVQIDVLRRLLDKYDPLVIRGDVKDRHAITLEAERREKCVVLIQADCAEGYQLPSFPVCVFASMSYSYVKFEQICGRFLRMDKPSKTTFIYLLTSGDSIDKAVYDSIRRKEDFQINLYGKKRSEV